MTAVGAGKRAGDRQQRARLRPDLLLLALGITFTIIAWGYLVFAAIDFGATARHDGETAAWAYLLLASLGAVLCLFLGFMLAVRLSRAIGLTHAPEPRPRRDPAAPKGGKRAAR
jgi:fatty acid desaturase